MASPWGTGTYPPPGPPGQYPPPPPTFQNDQRRQIQFPQPAIPGFYNPAVAAAAQYQPSRPGYSGAISSQFNSAAATGHIPSALQPGGGMHRTTSIPNMRPNGSDFYYQQPPPMPPMQQQYVAPQHHAPPMRHTQSVPPPLPHKPYNQPPLPPKPPLNTPANGVPPGGAMYPQSVVGPGPPPQTSPTSVQAFSGVHYPARDKVHPETRHHHTVPAGMHPQQVANMGAPLQMFPNHNPDPRDTVPDFSQFTPDVKEPPTRPTPRHTLNTPPQEDDEDEELRRVLEMSAKAAEEAKRHKNSKEEEELARALQESLHVNHRVPQPQYGGLDAESSHNVMFPSPETLSSSLPPESSTSNSVSPAFSNSTLPTTAYSYESHEIYDQKSSTNPFTSSPRNFASQIADDEAFARRLMEEEREREEREEQEQREQEERDRREQEEIERREREEKERREREDKERREREDKERREREERDRREREARVRREREEQERREREEREHRERERERERRERTQSQPPPIRPNEQPPPFESSPPIPPAQESPPRTPQPALPLYDDVVSSPPAAPAPAPISIPSPQTSHAAPPVASSNSLYPSMATHHAAPTSHSRQPSPSPSPGPAPTLVRSISANATVTSAPTPPLASLQDTRSGRSQSFTAFGAGPSSPGLRASQPSPTSGSSQVIGAQQISPRPSVTSAHLAVVEERNEPSPQPSSSRPVNVPYVSDSILTANQLVDAELLRGVSLGFFQPTVSAVLTPMQGAIPNVISLPYGRDKSAFHLKAPSWRALLKLMARLSGTRLEPTLEDMAVVKTEMKLRVVVSFVKVHQSSSDWHVLLYITIDLPPPQNAHTYKTRNNETTSLPFSYSVSPVPNYLRDGSDAPMSKWYSIPETPQTGYPTLPISFPNLATYLMAALEESRASSQDNTRRLSKIIDMCYPSEQPADDGEQESSGMGGLFSLFRRNRHRQTRDRNADTFDVVTPFVPDEWGA